MKRYTTNTVDPRVSGTLVHIIVLEESKLRHTSLKMAWKQAETFEEVKLC